MEAQVTPSAEGPPGLGSECGSWEEGACLRDPDWPWSHRTAPSQPVADDHQARPPSSPTGPALQRLSVHCRVSLFLQKMAGSAQPVSSAQEQGHSKAPGDRPPWHTDGAGPQGPVRAKGHHVERLRTMQGSKEEGQCCPS